MKSFVPYFLIFSSIISVICVIPEWNLEKAGENLLTSQSNEYTYIVTQRLFSGIFLSLTRRIYRENNVVKYTNNVYMNYFSVNEISKSVEFDNIESYYYINNQYIICPKGSYYPYNLNTEEYLENSAFPKKGSKE